MATKKRIAWIDIAKGITILLSVLGHTTLGSAIHEKWVFAIIYSFHMPLFFLLSGITARYSKDGKEFIKNTIRYGIRLLTPVILVWLIYSINSICMNPSSFLDFSFLKESKMWAAWFFLALYVSRTIFDGMQLILRRGTLLFGVLIVGLIGSFISKSLQGTDSLEFFSIDIALTAIPFIYLGYKWNYIMNIFNKFSYKNKWFFLLGSFAIWGIIVICSYDPPLDMAARSLPLYPLCYLGALAGSVLIITFSKSLENFKIITPLKFLGKNCLYFYLVHCIDLIWSSWYNVTSNVYLNFLIRVTIDLAFFSILLAVIYLFKTIKNKSKLHSSK